MNKKVNKIIEKLELLDQDMFNIIACLETIENSLYFASERKDKDMTRPCAAAVTIVNNMLDRFQDSLYGVKEELEELRHLEKPEV